MPTPAKKPPAKKPVRVAVTGAAGNIAYALLFRIAAGEMLGRDQPVILQLLEIPAAVKQLQGVVMELADSAQPLLAGVTTTDDAHAAFADADYALLVGSKPRSAGMERGDLLNANGKIFTAQGAALNAVASRTVKVLVVGNPANTNALIAAANAPDLPRANFTAMTRLDHNRAKAMLGEKLGLHSAAIRRVSIWGNHSATQYPETAHAFAGDKLAAPMLDKKWLAEEFIPAVQQRGAAIINARGASSAASAATAAIEHMRDWAAGSARDDWVSMALPSAGDYEIDDGLIFSLPVVCEGGGYKVVQNLTLSEFAREKIRASEQELIAERDAVRGLL